MAGTVGALEETLGHIFADKALLREALTHPSAGTPHYQRLEFLGDRVLGLCVAAWVYEAYPHATEGDMARRHTTLVRTETLAAAAQRLGLAPLIVRGPGETAPVGAGVLADVLEALLGALWLDGGMAAATQAVRRLLQDQLPAAGEKDPKTALQERVQAKGDPLPVYTVLQEDGPPHAPVFTVRVDAAGLACEGTAGSKQQAGQLAARDLLIKLEEVITND